jgi:hydroxyacylglutathione hydrolase
MVVVVDDASVKIERLTLGQWDTNSYIVICRRTGNSVIVDVPADASTILKNLEGTNVQYILMTHSHIDHTGALEEIKSELKVPLIAHKADANQLPIPPDITPNDGDTLSLGKVRIEVLHTPGHTPGSLCFRIGKYLLSGDTIFPGGPGNTSSPSNFKLIIRSITEKVLVLPDNTQLHPGHGESTTVVKAKEEFTIFSSRPHDANLCNDVLWLSS